MPQSQAGMLPALAMTKLLVTVARADVVLRPVELLTAADILITRLGLDRAAAQDLLLAALGRAEHGTTLLSCLNHLVEEQGPQALEAVMEDLRRLAVADAELHANEAIILDGLDRMKDHMLTRARDEAA
ncbi:MAG: TerB family tellurite resistance protein [Anderseniella sp.]|nr:TerB family tellurite resistance protein [Anderseniella sp.]